MTGDAPGSSGAISRELLRNSDSTDVVVLGAGFSKAVSDRFPLTDPLGRLALAEAGLPERSAFPGGSFEAWLSQLAEPQPYLEQAENTANLALFQRLVRALHTVMCAAECEAVQAGLPAWLARFVSALHARRATVITFNYDRVIERTLESLELHDFERADGEQAVTWADVLGDVPPYPPLPARFAGEVRHTLHLLKLHGSLNWYWVPGDSSGATLQHWELDDDVEGRARYLPGREPFVVPPAATKSAFFRNPIVSDIWQRASRALCDAGSVALVGYSMPLADMVAVGMFANALAGGPSTLTVVDLCPEPVVEAARKATGKDSEVVPSVEAFADGYVESASRSLAGRVREGGPSVPYDARVLVGWRVGCLARVVAVERDELGVVLVAEAFDDPTPTAPLRDPSPRRPAVGLTAVVDLLEAGDRIVLRFASGQESPAVGISRLRTATGASCNWQVLLPADRPSDVDTVGSREQHERGAS